MKQYYLQTKAKVLEELKTGSGGLSSQQAKDNLTKYGKNALIEGKKKTTLQVFLEQFKDLMVIILIIAAVISAFTGELESTLVIIAVLILNAILGTVQHIKADPLSLFQDPEAVHQDLRVMHKDVSIFFIGDESISFIFIEPFYRAFHLSPSFLQNVEAAEPSSQTTADEHNMSLLPP